MRSYVVKILEPATDVPARLLETLSVKALGIDEARAAARDLASERYRVRSVHQGPEGLFVLVETGPVPSSRSIPESRLRYPKA